MGFFSNIISATVKTVLTPIAIVSDAVSVVTGEDPKATSELVQSAVEDLGEATDDLCDGEL